MSKTKKKTVYIIYTGGTIGMHKTTNGYVPAAGFLKQQMSQMPQFTQPDMPNYVLCELSPLFDSANVQVDDWNRIANEIKANYDKYAGFVVLHGTDTMAYTASALSFMLEDLSKPVILTGSQVPLFRTRNDARDNLINSILLACHYDIPEVCIYFNDRLFRGNRTQKVNAASFSAFASPNLAPLAEIGLHIELRKDLITRAATKPLRVQQLKPACIAFVRLFPGMSLEILKNVLQQPLQALVLSTYGSGNAPDNNPDFITQLSQANHHGTIIVNCTQCKKGRVDMKSYATGHALKEAGLISAVNMTPEAALTKLYYLFSKNLSNDSIKQQFQTNLRGELDP